MGLKFTHNLRTTRRVSSHHTQHTHKVVRDYATRLVVVRARIYALYIYYNTSTSII